MPLCASVKSLSTVRIDLVNGGHHWWSVNIETISQRSKAPISWGNKSCTDLLTVRSLLYRCRVSGRKKKVLWLWSQTPVVTGRDAALKEVFLLFPEPSLSEYDHRTHVTGCWRSYWELGATPSATSSNGKRFLQLVITSKIDKNCVNGLLIEEEKLNSIKVLFKIAVAVTFLLRPFTGHRKHGTLATLKKRGKE